MSVADAVGSVCLLVLCLTAFVPSAQAAFPGKNGKIAYSTYVEGVGYQVQTIEPDGSGRSVVLQGTDPAWSADGTRLAFAFGNIFTARADGSDVVQVTDHPPCEFICTYSTDPSFSPDGTMLAKADLSCAPRAGCDERISRINVDGSGDFGLAIYAGQPAWAPDGSTIAFKVSYSGILLTTTDGSDNTLTENQYDSAPNWSPDGTRIAFTRFIPDRGSSEVYVMNADGTNQVRLTDNQVFDIEPAWSPDGSKIVFGRAEGNQIDLFTMNPDGTGATNVTSSPDLSEYDADWQPLAANQPPDCSGVTATPSSLGRHGFQTVTLAGATDPDRDPVAIAITGVTQDEPVGRRPDARAGDSPDQVELRGQRRPRGDGRVYRIAFTVSDGTDACSGVATVEVRRKKKQPAVDSAPPSYDSFGP